MASRRCGRSSVARRTCQALGEGVQTVRREATVTGAVEEGSLITYTAAVLEDERHGAQVPGLLGLEPLAERNTYVGTHTGELAMVPNGTDLAIEWPKGTKRLRCVKGRGGHWMLPLGKWSNIKSRKVQEAFVNEIEHEPPAGASSSE